MLILQKSLKSIQIVLNEFFEKISSKMKKFITVSASAFTKARSKLLHTAFIELNEKCIVASMYEDGDYKTFKGFRLLAIDSSTIILPDEEDIRNEFGVITVTNQYEKVYKYTAARASVCYDVLNKIGIDSILTKSTDYEGELAIKHLEHCNTNDLLIFDRGYPSYFLLATLISKNINFVIRCSRSSFNAAKEMFECEKPESITVPLKPNNAKFIREKGLPSEIKVRFIRVELDNGEIEVLVTSLLDNKKYPNKIFKEIYNRRWKIETFFDVIKNRLNLENFTGKTVESVKQDFFSTILITGLETILTDDAQQILDEKSTKNQQPQIVNKAISFNVIKNNVFDLFYQELDDDVLLEKLTKLFLTKTTSVKKKKSRKRIKTKLRRTIKYYKYKRKICF